MSPSRAASDSCTVRDPDRWLVVGPDGTVAATIDLPPSLEVHDIGLDYLLASTTDELGVERVRLWALARSR